MKTLIPKIDQPWYNEEDQNILIRFIKKKILHFSCYYKAVSVSTFLSPTIMLDNDMPGSAH